MIETEVILLKNIYDHINKMVNFGLFDINGKDPRCNILFHDGNQKKLFFILLVDFLSQTDEKIPIKKTTFLQGLDNISKNPQFSVSNSEKELESLIVDFTEWLQKKRSIDIWMPSINQQVKLIISVSEAIYICGNISKHNYLRTGVSRVTKPRINSEQYAYNYPSHQATFAATHADFY